MFSFFVMKNFFFSKELNFFLQGKTLEELFKDENPQKKFVKLKLTREEKKVRGVSFFG